MLGDILSSAPTEAQERRQGPGRLMPVDVFLERRPNSCRHTHVLLARDLS